MKITVIGSGYVGLVTGACLAELGNEVVCLDLDQKKIDLLNNGQIPIYEPGLEQMIRQNQHSGRIQFSTNIKSAVLHGDVQYIAVGTPADEDGSADLKYVLAAARNIGKYMTNFKVIVNKSTVPVGTADKVKTAISDELAKNNTTCNFSIVSNPEFLKEGSAIDDFMRPDRIVIGTYSDDLGRSAKEIMQKLYLPFNRHHQRTHYMDIRSAELTKYAANAMLATRISFMNELANLADKVGADIDLVRQGIGSDSRIGYGFLYAGTGYGGSCFPKDVQALIETAKLNDQEFKILKAVESVNNEQKTILVSKILTHYRNDLSGKTFAIWGLAFKPNTDDMREAPSREIIKELVKRGARVQAYDPVANIEAEKAFDVDLLASERAQLVCVESMKLAIQSADALIIITEWKSFRSPDFDDLKKELKMPVIFDGRNLYEPTEMKEIGFTYYGVGRSTNKVS